MELRITAPHLPDEPPKPRRREDRRERGGERRERRPRGRSEKPDRPAPREAPKARSKPDQPQAKPSREAESRGREAAALLKAMGNEHRLAILCLLCEGEHSVGRLVERVGLSQSALSQHLARLRAEQLVSTRRHGQTIHYALAGRRARTLIETLYGMYCE